MVKKYFLSIDQGTTGSTSLIVDCDTLEVIASANTEFTQHFPDTSFVEHDLHDIWRSVEWSTHKVLEQSQISPDQIKAIGITNQRETTCAYDKKGSPLARAIVWQDRRTQDFCRENKKNYQQYVKRTGLPLDPYFSATKMNWLLQNSTEVRKAAKNNNLRLSTIDSFLLYKLTSGDSFLTDATNASRTLLMDLETCKWDDDLLSFFEVDKTFLPEVVANTHNFGVTRDCSFLPDGIPIACMIGDQQSALLGQMAVNTGDIKCTYGTGAFLLLNTGMNIILSNNGLLTTVALKTNLDTSYALEGSTYIAGAVVQWLRDNLNILDTAGQIEKLANQVNDQEINELFFFPFFTGIGTPYWNSDAKAAIIGLTRASDKKHISRAALEGIALSVNDALEVFIKESPYPINVLKVDGGASMNALLMQMQANFSNIEINRSSVSETTALGAAIGCKLHIDSLSINELSKFYKSDRKFMVESKQYHEMKRTGWKKYISTMYK